MTFSPLTADEFDRAGEISDSIPVEVDNQRLEADFRQARRHSFIVGLLKRVLPLLALALVAWFAVMSLLHDKGVGKASVDSIGIKDGKLTMVEPRMKGFNKNNRPYDLDARQAVQDLKKPGIIDLKDIVAKLPTEGGEFIDVVARTGVYNTGKDLLHLQKDIVFTRAGGMKMMLETAEIDLKSGQLTSNKPVNVTTPTSNITADNMQVIDNGAVIVFDQRVRMNIQPANDSKP